MVPFAMRDPGDARRQRLLAREANLRRLRDLSPARSTSPRAGRASRGSRRSNPAILAAIRQLLQRGRIRIRAGAPR
jgi:hypothetical protein